MVIVVDLVETINKLHKKHHPKELFQILQCHFEINKKVIYKSHIYQK